VSDQHQNTTDERRAEKRLLKEFGYHLDDIRQTRCPQTAIIILGDSATISAPTRDEIRDRTLERHDHWLILDASQGENLIQAVELAEAHLSSGWTAPDDNHEFFEQTVRRWCANAAKDEASLVLWITNTHALTLGEICGIGATLQSAIAERWPLLPILSGTQKLRKLISRGPGYLERGVWIDLDE
jgi:hypothetical protein